MKKLLLLTVAIAISASMLAQAPHMKFKGLEINGNYKTFAQNLVKQGFKIIESAEDGIILTGNFMAHPETMTIVYPDPKTKNVTMVAAFIETDDTWISMEREFLSIVETYKQKYGEPAEFATSFNVEEKDLSDAWKKMYLQDGRCNYVARFETAEGAIGISIVYYMRKYGVMIACIDGQNKAEMDKAILDDI